ncbi:MAG: polysaccharide deacetylase, partial [Ruthenibacterium sp.]
YFDWNVCGEDAVGGHPGASEIYSNVVREADGKAVCIVLLHDTATTKNSAVALPQIIEWFQNAGYRFDTLDNKP